MHPYSSFNRGHHYIFTVIDVLSKYAWAVPLKSKGGSETADAIVEIIRASGRCPKNLQTDMGKEFYNVGVQKILKKHNVNHYSTYSTLKASVVERFNRTLKSDMWKMFTLNGNYKWIDELPRLVSDYNARKHRTIGMRPAKRNSLDRRKTLGHGVQRDKNRWSSKIQSGRFGTREQVQDDF